MKFFDIDKWSEVAHTLSANKKRTTATAFGVFWGILMLVIMVSVSSGFKNGIARMLEGANPNTAFLYASATSKPYMGYKSSRYWSMNSNDIKAIRQNVPEIEYMAISLWKYGPKVLYNGKKIDNVQLQAMTPESFNITPIKIVAGRMLQEQDEQGKRKVCLIGEKIKDQFFGSEDPLGKIISVDGSYVKVVGIITNANKAFGNFKNSILLPYTVMKEKTGQGDKINDVAFTAHGDIEKAIKKVRALLKQRHKIAPDDEKAVVATNMADFFELTNMMILGMDVLIWIIGIGTLLTGIIGVSNILLVTVRERTREIGVRRALGAKPKTIVNQLMSESLTLTISAGIVGMLMGIFIMALVDIVLQGQDIEFFYNPTIPLSTAIISLIIIITGGILGGLLPAYRAIQIKAIDAIRDE